MKSLRPFLLIALAACTLSSCATVFGGPTTSYQKTKPAAGQPKRSLRGGALAADILLFWPGAIIDFATGAIYKPQPKAPVAPAAAPAAAPASGN